MGYLDFQLCDQLLILHVTFSAILSVSAARLDISVYNFRAIASTSSRDIGGYSSGNTVSTVGTDFTFGRVVDTGTGTGLPINIRYEVFNNYGRRLHLGGGDEQAGVYYCEATANGETERIQTVMMSYLAGIKPEKTTMTVSLGDDVTITMTTSIQQSLLKWKHNGNDKPEWNGLKSITISFAKISDGGVYECYKDQTQRQDGKSGFMRLIVRGCPNGKYGVGCQTACPTCYNGGVCNADTGECICPPGFMGGNCQTACGVNKFGADCGRECSAINEPNILKCKASSICTGDPYGCSCATSLTASNCETICPPGTYGAGCTQTCHCTSGCNAATGCPGDSTCESGWSGTYCNIPSTCTAGMYGYLCNYNCHCKDNAACNKNTGACPNGECAPGWFSLTNKLNECQGVLPKFARGYLPTVEVEATQVTVQWRKWNESIDVGYGPVEAYRVYSKQTDGDDDWTQHQDITVQDPEVASYNTIVSGLLWSTSYDFAVAVKIQEQMEEDVKHIRTETTLCDVPGKPIISSAESTKPNEIQINVEVTDIRCIDNGNNGYIDFFTIRHRKANNGGDYESRIGPSGTDRSFTVAELMPYTEYEVEIKFKNADEESPWSTTVTVRTAEGVPGMPASIEIKQITYDSIELEWKEPAIFSGDIEHYGMRYISRESVFRSMVMESKTVLVEGDIHTYTLTNLATGTKYEIYLNASTSKGFGETLTVFTGTSFTVDVSEELTFSGDHLEPIAITDSTAIVTLPQLSKDTTLSSDSALLDYIIVVEYDKISERRKKREIDPDHLSSYSNSNVPYYITAAIPLKDLAKTFTIGDGSVYDGYFNAPLIPTIQYYIYYGFASDVTGEIAYSLENEPRTSFKAAGPTKGTSPLIGAIIGGIFAPLLVLCIIIGVVLFIKRMNSRKIGENTQEEPCIEIEKNDEYAEPGRNPYYMYPNMETETGRPKCSSDEPTYESVGSETIELEDKPVPNIVSDDEGLDNYMRFKD
ncbi:uncharacterized protein LOC144436825 [Glandiceps talaboti]